MSKYDLAKAGTFKACQVPGPEVIAEYCKLEAVKREAEATWRAAGNHRELYVAYVEACARCEGFRHAVELYCPSEHGYTNTSGHLIMAADMALDPDHRDDAARQAWEESR